MALPVATALREGEQPACLAAASRTRQRRRSARAAPSGFPGNFRKLKVLGTLWCFHFGFRKPLRLGQAKRMEGISNWFR